MSTTATLSGPKWKGRESKHFSIPLPPPQYSQAWRCLQCTSAHCVIIIEKTVYVFSIPSFLLIHSLQHADPPVNLDLHDNILITISIDHSVRAFNLVTGDCEATIENPKLWEKNTLIYCDIRKREQRGDDNGRLHTKGARRENLVLLWQRFTSTLYIWRLGYSGDHPPSTTSQRIAGYDDLQSITTSRQKMSCLSVLGVTAATGGVDGTVRIWDLTSGDCDWTLMGHTHSVVLVCLDESRIYSASADRDETVRVWDRSTGECVHIFKPTGSFPPRLPISISPPYLMVVSAMSPTFWDNIHVKVWESESGKPIFETEAQFLPSPYIDAHKVILVGPEVQYNVKGEAGQQTIKIFDTQTGQLMQTIGTGIETIHLLTANGQFLIVLAVNHVEALSLEVWDFGVDDDDDGESWAESEQARFEDDAPS